MPAAFHSIFAWVMRYERHLSAVAMAVGFVFDAYTFGATLQLAGDQYHSVLRRGYRSILLVTSKYHSMRAGRIYRYLADGRVTIIVRPARDDDFQPDAWWRDRPSTRRVVIEYQKLLTFLLLDRWLLPPVRVESGATPGPA